MKAPTTRSTTKDDGAVTWRRFLLLNGVDSFCAVLRRRESMSLSWEGFVAWHRFPPLHGVDSFGELNSLNRSGEINRMLRSLLLASTLVLNFEGVDSAVNFEDVDSVEQPTAKAPLHAVSWEGVASVEQRTAKPPLHAVKPSVVCFEGVDLSEVGINYWVILSLLHVNTSTSGKDYGLSFEELWKGFALKEGALLPRWRNAWRTKPRRDAGHLYWLLFLFVTRNKNSALRLPRLLLLNDIICNLWISAV